MDPMGQIHHHGHNYSRIMKKCIQVFSKLVRTFNELEPFPVTYVTWNSLLLLRLGCGRSCKSCARTMLNVSKNCKEPQKRQWWFQPNFVRIKWNEMKEWRKEWRNEKMLNEGRKEGRKEGRNVAWRRKGGRKEGRNEWMNEYRCNWWSFRVISSPEENIHCLSWFPEMTPYKLVHLGGELLEKWRSTKNGCIYLGEKAVQHVFV